MVWLHSSPSRLCWVGHEEVARGDVFGNWKRFVYFVNGHRQYVYCRTKKVFLTLFEQWCNWASIANRRKKPEDLPISDERWNKIKYDYHTICADDGVDISTEGVIMDNPDSKPFRVKSLIQTQYGEYIQ